MLSVIALHTNSAAKPWALPKEQVEIGPEHQEILNKERTEVIQEKGGTPGWVSCCHGESCQLGQYDQAGSYMIEGKQ